MQTNAEFTKNRFTAHAHPLVATHCKRPCIGREMYTIIIIFIIILYQFHCRMQEKNYQKKKKQQLSTFFTPNSCESSVWVSVNGCVRIEKGSWSQGLACELLLPLMWVLNSRFLLTTSLPYTVAQLPVFPTTCLSMSVHCRNTHI